MKFLQAVSLWGGVAGVIVAIFAIIILFLTRRNIINILEKDQILFDKNYEMRKNAIENSLNVVDYLVDYGTNVLTSKTFIQKARTAYNDMMVMVHNAKLIDAFYALCLDDTRESVTAIDVAVYKSMCRKEIGFKAMPTSYIGGKNLNEKAVSKLKRKQEKENKEV